MALVGNIGKQIPDTLQEVSNAADDSISLTQKEAGDSVNTPALLTQDVIESADGKAQDVFTTSHLQTFEQNLNVFISAGEASLDSMISSASRFIVPEATTNQDLLGSLLNTLKFSEASKEEQFNQTIGTATQAIELLKTSTQQTAPEPAKVVTGVVASIVSVTTAVMTSALTVARPENITIGGVSSTLSGIAAAIDLCAQMNTSAKSLLESLAAKSGAIDSGDRKESQVMEYVSNVLPIARSLISAFGETAISVAKSALMFSQTVGDNLLMSAAAQSQHLIDEIQQNRADEDDLNKATAEIIAEAERIIEALQSELKKMNDAQSLNRTGDLPA